MPTVDLRVRPRRAVFGAALVLALLSAVLAAPTAAFADDIDALSASPSDGSARDGRTRFDYQAAPGQQLNDAILVRNAGTTVQSVTVFATDAYSNDEGDFALLTTDQEPRDAGAWVSFDGNPRVVLELQPGDERVLTFTVAVPADATPGDHAGGIVISAMSPDGTIVVDRRVATRIYLRVPGEIQPGLTLSGLDARYKQVINPFDGSVTVTATITNPGNVALRGSMAFGVTTWFGIGATASIREELPELLPGATRTVTVELPAVAQLGYLNASVRLLPKSDEGSLPMAPFTEVRRDTMIVAWPWWILAVAAVALSALVIVRIRRRSDEKRAAAWIAYTEEEARRQAASEADEPRT